MAPWCCSEIYKGCLWLFYLFIWLPGVLVAACGLNRSVACGILVPRMTRDRTRVPCTGRWILNHRPPGKSLKIILLALPIWKENGIPKEILKPPCQLVCIFKATPSSTSFSKASHVLLKEVSIPDY